MRKKVLFALATLISVAAVLVSAPTAAAGDTVCMGPLFGAHDNVVVPAPFTCDVFGATIKGNVKVYGSINVFGPATIGGSLDAEPGHGFVRIFSGNTILGNVQVKGSTAGIAAGFLGGNTIGGNFQWEENNNFLVAFGSTIGGNVKAEKNTGGGFIGGGNTIGGNVECKENTPPIGEGGNNVSGTDRDKCPE